MIIGLCLFSRYVIEKISFQRFCNEGLRLKYAFSGMATTTTTTKSKTKSKSKHNKSESQKAESSGASLVNSDNSENSEEQKPTLFKRDAFICSSGHHGHLDEDYETDETILVGRKIRTRWPSDRISIDSRSLRSVSSEATLSIASSLDYAPTPLGTLERKKHLQTVPEEGRVSLKNSHDSQQDLNSVATFETTSISSQQFSTPKQAKRHFNLFRRFRSTDEKSTRRDSLSSTGSRKDNFQFARANSIDSRPVVVDTYEPYSFYEGDFIEEPRKLKKQPSKSSLHSTSRNAEGRLLVARGSVVHPTGVFSESGETHDPASSYATVVDPTSGRPRLIRRDSIIHPPGGGGRENADEIAQQLLNRRNSVIRPLALDGDAIIGENETEGGNQPRLYKRFSITHSYNDAEADIKETDNNRYPGMMENAEAEAPSSSKADDSSTPHLPQPIIVENGRFQCPWTTWSTPKLMDILTWKVGSKNNSNLPPESVLKRRLPVKTPIFVERPENGIRVTWLGHAMVLIQMDGINILTDPIFSERASMVSFMGPKRYRPVPCSVHNLPTIHAVLISHNHYDHLDYPSVELLNARFGDTLRWYVPLGLERWMREANCTNVVELSWWESDKMNYFDNIQIVFTPTQHWCKRSTYDTNQVLWGSWCVLGPRHRFFFAGDTGYCKVFKIIGKMYGPFDLAAIPIGAYEPRWFMSPQHVDPDEAVAIHEDVKAVQSIGIHWGTFVLANEHYLDPPRVLQQALSRKALPPHVFFTLNHGESRTVHHKD